MPHNFSKRPASANIILVNVRNQKSLRRNDYLCVVIKVELREKVNVMFATTLNTHPTWKTP